MNDVPETEMPVAEVYELRLYVAGQSPKSVTASRQHRAHPSGVATAARETRRLSDEFGWQGSAGAMYVCGRELKEPHAGE
jgi:hypothetical protein